MKALRKWKRRREAKKEIESIGVLTYDPTPWVDTEAWEDDQPVVEI